MRLMGVVGVKGGLDKAHKLKKTIEINSNKMLTVTSTHP